MDHQVSELKVSCDLRENHFRRLVGAGGRSWGVRSYKVGPAVRHLFMEGGRGYRLIFQEVWWKIERKRLGWCSRAGKLRGVMF